MRLLPEMFSEQLGSGDAREHPVSFATNTRGDVDRHS